MPYSEYRPELMGSATLEPSGPVEAGYWANAWLRMRHPDYDTLRAMMNDVGETMQLRAR